MVYMGGKQRFSKSICPILNTYIKSHNIKNFYDILCGGFNIGSQIDCENIYANDLSPTLIALHKQAQEDFSKIPLNSSREQWDRCKEEYKRIEQNNFLGSTIPLYEIGAIEWFGCYSGRWFPGSYAIKSSGRNQFDERVRNLKKQSELPAYQKAHFSCGDYSELSIEPNSLIYCDAPYINTQIYGVSKGFNYNKYYEWLMETAKKFPIFISEQTLPDTIPATIVWEKEVKRGIGKISATERLYFLDLRN